MKKRIPDTEAMVLREEVEKYITRAGHGAISEIMDATNISRAHLHQFRKDESNISPRVATELKNFLRNPTRSAITTPAIQPSTTEYNVSETIECSHCYNITPLTFNGQRLLACGHCGAPLGIPCGRCGHINTDEAPLFCTACTAPLNSIATKLLEQIQNATQDERTKYIQAAHDKLRKERAEHKATARFRSPGLIPE